MSGVKQEAQEVLGEGEHLLEEANQLSDNINKELEVQMSHYKKSRLSLKNFKTSVDLSLQLNILSEVFFWLGASRLRWGIRKEVLNVTLSL